MSDTTPHHQEKGGRDKNILPFFSHFSCLLSLLPSSRLPAPSPPFLPSEEAMETPAKVNGSPLSRRCQKLLQRRQKLPVWSYREKFLDTLAKHQIVVVAAPPGSGKSTQVLSPLLVPLFSIKI